MFDQLMPESRTVRQVQRPRPPKAPRAVDNYSLRGKGHPCYRPNPWGLTGAQIHCITSIIECGTARLAAKKMGLEHKTVEAHTARVRALMGVRTFVHVALKWDRFVRGEQ